MHDIYKRHVKRLLDIFVSTATLVALSPVLVLLGLLVRIKLGAPVLFRQQRPGLEGQPFYLVKFRTMTDRRGATGHLLPDADRLTKFGRFLRRCSLDELPELWNILKGDMSLVGPRPLLMEYLPYYSERELRRHTVRPGLTGLAQISGRNCLTWDERLGCDVEYVEKLSLGLDMRIIWRTVGAVFLARGVGVDSSKAEGNLAQIRRGQGQKLSP